MSITNLSYVLFVVVFFFGGKKNYLKEVEIFNRFRFLINGIQQSKSLKKITVSTNSAIIFFFHAYVVRSPFEMYNAL